MRKFTSFDLSYAHRFFGFQGEEQYFHDHTDTLPLEAEDTANLGSSKACPSVEIKKVTLDAVKDLDHSLFYEKMNSNLRPECLYMGNKV